MAAVVVVLSALPQTLCLNFDEGRALILIRISFFIFIPFLAGW
jgi:hypothetical protein